MAAFQIREEIQNIQPYQKNFCALIEDKENIPQKRNVIKNKTKTKALQNHTKQEPKRVKLSVKEICQGNEKNEENFEKNVLPDITFLQIQSNKPSQKMESPYFPDNLLYCDDYRQEIWSYLKVLEVKYNPVKPNFMLKQPDLNWHTRSVLIDWLASVSDEYKFSDETFHVSVNFIDRFLNQISVVRTKFQLVGAAAMMVATKMEEYYPLDSKEWSFLTGDTFSPRQILKMEQLILKVLRFRMQPPTIYRFIQQLCTEEKMDNRTVHMAMYISELVLLEGEDYLNHFPSKLAAAAIVLARYLLSKKDPWPAKLKEVSGYTLKELSPVIQKQHQTFKDSPLKSQQAIQTKYKSPKYNRVATMKPRVLMLDDFNDED